ncbi:MAG: type II toxin-antitoxin system RelE/ParE family toxin [Pseudomonadota bacterium]|nr:type II toxin-antitoxin system RelE/ParE family toxin [Pseudomonadota bacterium]
MARVVVTPSADADTAEILAFLAAKAGLGVAAQYNASFERLYDHWADFPESGAPRPRVGARIRIGVVSPYVVIYRHTEDDNTVRVLRIVHGRRMVTGKLIRGGS